MKTPGQLTNKQARFVQEYLIDLNAAKAAMRAGFAESVAYSQACLWVGKNRDLCPAKYRHVWDAVQTALKARLDEVNVSAKDVLIWLKEMMEADISEAVDENGQLRDFADMPRGLKNLLSGFDVHEVYDNEEQRLASRTKKPRFTKKLDVLALLGKHVNVQAFKEQVEHQHKVDLASAIQNARKQAKQQG